MYRTVKISILLIFSSFVTCDETTLPCLPEQYTTDHMDCVCDSVYCDTLDVPPKMAKSEFIHVISSIAGDRFNIIRGIFLTANHYGRVKPLKPFNLNSTYIKINEISNGRAFSGMGGTHTGSSAYLLRQMAPSLQDNLLTSYYSNDFGNGFSKIRIPIGGTANDLSAWTYAENDPNFSNLSITNAEDDSRLDQLQDILATYDGDELEIIAYPSTAPKWMKQNSTYFGSSIQPKFYQRWADYLVEYLKLMQNHGINITSLSTGERPHTSWRPDQNTPSMAWNPFEQGKWLAEFLGPTMKTSGFSNVKIQAYDDDRSKIPLWISLMSLGNVNALNYIDTIDIQGYKDKLFPAGLIDLSYSTFVGKSIYVSEMSFPGPPVRGSWQRAEEYIENIYENLKHDTQAYLFLNLLIDERGGPSLNNNSQLFDAPIVVSSDFTRFYRQPSFYAISHFSRFILPGSVRLDISVIGINSNMPILAFLRPDGSVVVIIYNSSNEIAPVTISDRYQGTIESNLKPKSINTIIY